jgi:homopolymeric O-antigen transport system permease protein
MSVSHNIKESLRVLINYRGRLLEAVISDIRQRYHGSILGILWIMIYPLLQLSIYAALYSVVFKIRPSGLTELGYVVLVFSGLVPLMAFGEALSSATSSLSSNKDLLLNTVFPVELIPLRAVLTAQPSALFGLLVTLIVGFSIGSTSWQAILLVPVFWLLLIMFVTGLGWILSLIMMAVSDVQHGLGIVIMLLFILSPFAYTPEMMPAALKYVIYINPLSYFVLVFQQLICYGVWPDPFIVAGAFLLAFVSFFMGLMFFNKTKVLFFDYA